MTTFVGAEYIIANLLIVMKKNHKKEFISLEGLNSAGVYIQKLSIEEDIDAIFLCSSDQLLMALFNFADYFEFNAETQEIRVVKTKKISDLESRFIGYLPLNVLTFLVDATSKAVYQQI